MLVVTCSSQFVKCRWRRVSSSSNRQRRTAPTPGRQSRQRSQPANDKELYYRHCYCIVCGIVGLRARGSARPGASRPSFVEAPSHFSTIHSFLPCAARRGARGGGTRRRGGAGGWGSGWGESEWWGATPFVFIAYGSDAAPCALASIVFGSLARRQSCSSIPM